MGRRAGLQRACPRPPCADRASRVTAAHATLVDEPASPRQHARVPKRPSSSLTCLALALAPLACEPVGARPPEPPAAAPPTLTAPSSAPSAPALPRGHTPIAEGHVAELPFALQPIGGGRGAIAIAQVAGLRAAFARRLDASGMGAIERVLDRRVLGAVERAGRTTLITSSGSEICADRACVGGAPAAIVPVGDRLALLEVRKRHAPEPAARAVKAAPKPAAGPARGKAAKPPKITKGAKKGAKKKPTPAAPARRPSRPLVELFVRWIGADGAIDAEAKSTGLHFEAPLEGMTLVDARARGGGVDLLWYESAPGRRARTPLGSGRLMAGSLRADGALDFASRAAVVDADLEYGRLKDHHAPRLVGDDAGSAYLGVGEKGACEAARVRPSIARLTPPPAACAVAPDALAGAIEAESLRAFDRILAEDPRRVFGQPRSDFGRTVWAGDRAFWLRGSTLRSASKSDGAARDEPPPFPARRARITWGALLPEGEGVALVDGRLTHVDARVSPPVVRSIAAAGLPASPEIAADRRAVARIGDTFFQARGERRRLWPDLAPPAPQRRADGSSADAAHVDTTVLVGGTAAGIALDLVGGALQAATVNARGEATPLTTFAPSPVRPGYDACERAAGGALVAGVSPSSPPEVVVFTLDAGGHAGPARRAPLPLRAGELFVRLVPLPGGGAWLTDLDRRHVVWLDDEARPIAEAAWPAEESDAACVDGRPMRLRVPGPKPGSMVAVPDAAEGVCVIGDPVWGPDGSLRWLGASSLGLDSYADVAVTPRLADVTTPPAPAPPPTLSPAASVTAVPARCPRDMVSIAGRFCVDRFESILVDARSGEPLSPDYPTTPNLLEFALGEWATGRERIGTLHARAFPLPFLDPARLGDKPDPVAASRLHARPNGYLTGLVAESACAAAGKRLCSLDEFVMACRGEGDTLFPYGDTYEEGLCNVFREDHPAALLHNNASVGHLDPRLNRVSSRGNPLLRRTGQSPACRSKWGDDAIYDMVGNLDEWVNEGNGAFAGGFYARSTRSGCEALVTAHPKTYLDYSTGARCCR